MTLKHRELVNDLNLAWCSSRFCSHFFVLKIIICTQEETLPAQPPNVRGPERRKIIFPEAEIYRRLQFSAADVHGNVASPARCPSQLAGADTTATSCCHIVRQGYCTKHGVVASGFPVALSDVPKFLCRTHGRSFTLLHPLVHEDLPPTLLVVPEIVVLTEDLVFLKEAYEKLAVQVQSSCHHACMQLASGVSLIE